MIAELCLRVVDGLRMPPEWNLDIVVPVFMGMVRSGIAVAT